MRKVRLRYAKRERLRFMSHRDVARAFERALRRGGVPMAYSQGFSPHPRVSWVGAAPTGAASEAEYVEVQLAERVPAAVLRSELNRALPAGLDILDAVEAGPGVLAHRIDVSLWVIELPGVSPLALASAAASLWAEDRAEVERLTKNGRVLMDVRPALLGLSAGQAGWGVPIVSPLTMGDARDDGLPGGAGRPVAAEVPPGHDHGAAQGGAVVSDDRVDDRRRGAPPCGILAAVVRQATPTVRPDDVLGALRVVAGLEPPVPAKATRMAQGTLDDDGCIVDPLAADRTVANEATGPTQVEADGRFDASSRDIACAGAESTPTPGR
ncbi:TIGR03936 family radical SAM-associated protein [Actinoalloteichus sp. AHMU CJ021]|uniref:TIGR03936 family radical SAM-associated protein n=1 Tax=Actinoalloteichus sp. AHMU CJ021 TaxID=2072503 RepID=UPI00269230B8